jgi:oligoendopeptidase F
MIQTLHESAGFEKLPDMTQSREINGAEYIHWNLDDLYESSQDLEEALERADHLADELDTQYRGNLSQLTAAELAEALSRFEIFHDLLDRAYTYAYLNWCTGTTDPARGALLQRVRERYTSVSQKLIFFELELISFPQEQTETLIQQKELFRFRHFLEVLQLRREHVLSEPEEKVLAEKSVTGSGAWTRFFDEVLGAAEFPFRSDLLSEQDILSKLYDADREVRRDAASGFTQGLETYLRNLTYAFNTLLADKASDDRLRGYPHWLRSRNLSNEISDESVRTLVDSVTSRYDLVARFYQLKRRILGLDELFDYDRYAPIESVSQHYDWESAQDLVLSAYHAFAPKMGDIASRFFEHGWIDAGVSPGKRSGAFSHRAVPEVHPYILMNFTGKFRDVQTLAHELGHGVHQYLSRVRGSLQGSTPLTTAEMASVFGEMLVFDKILSSESDPRSQLSMLIGKIDDTLATVFRQIAMNQFEERIHEARRGEGELSAERFSALWIETQEAMFQGSVTLCEHYRIWWSYIPHFVHTPGYVYAYAFGELLVLALYALYQERREGFADRYLELLEAGGSDWPHVLIGRLGVDLQDPAFWQRGLGEIEKLIDQAEDLLELTQPK